MKHVLWALLIIAGSAVGLWFVTSPWLPRTTLEMVALVVFFMASGLGGLWAVYMVVRHETRVFPAILIVLLPYGFLWYYFERVRRKPRSDRYVASS